jgi:2-C-methyl-D-erythritol 4-phosphate cytidylyltransferase/2-C-methyl-D-erythritol 2,4-cyclodiphosphate synthase
VKTRPFAGCILVAAGEGRRLGGVRKGFLELAGRPLVLHAAERLAAAPEVAGIVLVVHADDLVRAKKLVKSEGKRLGIQSAVPGGARRQDSVAAGLAALPEREVVLIHDAARPLVDPAVVSQVAVAGRARGPSPTGRGARGEGPLIAATVDRAGLWAAQTPQGFRTALYRELLAKAEAENLEVTDDAAVFERYGHAVELVPSPAGNLKITLPEDLVLAELVIGSRGWGLGSRSKSRPSSFAPAPSPETRDPAVLRYGTGYDIHALEPGRKLIIGGLEVDSPVGARAHSDGDALCHAVMDALLGAAALGDIGKHFPDTDAKWRGARSLDMLGAVREKLAAAGFAPANVDATIMLEKPKLKGLKDKMAANIAEVLGLPVSAVSVKAGTNEGLGEIGAGKAVAAQAIASIRLS